LKEKPSIFFTNLKNYTFTLSIIFAALIAFLFPYYFIEYQGYKFSGLIIPLLQLIMFGVGATMSPADFVGVLKTPKKVLIGLLCQFTIMPILGFSIAKAFGFPNEIAAGVVLVGCSPSGLASNVMCLIAKANVPLSITITSIATLLSPLLTPLLMRLLANEFIEIETAKMVIDILKMVIVPVLLGVLMNVYLGKFTLYLNKVLPVLSMIGIALIIVIITAAGQASLKTVGFSLVFGVLIHNVGGYFLGYNMAKMFKLNQQDCRTVAIEVGLQNSGLASGIAVQMAKITTVGLAPALFGPIMNLSGSLLAGYWSKKK
jgi:bile acid:Na+ symporter, BASS family